jgi:hypothetical protein
MTSADPDLLGITRVAAQICGAASAAVDLVRPGRPAGPLLCDVAVGLTGAGPLVVPDTRADERFARHPCVTGELGKVRFYAASRLVA